MSIESPELGGNQPKDEKINDVEQSWIGALGEKPVRDLAREQGVNEEEKAILDRLAERRGEKAMQEYTAEKEKNPIEILLARIDKIAAELKEQGLDQDVAILEKIRQRYIRYAETLKQNQKKLEKLYNRRVSLTDIQNIPEYTVAKGIPVAHEIGEGGGSVYWPNGCSGSWFGKKGDLEVYKDSLEKATESGGEIINWQLTEEGQTIFYRGLGVLNENEEPIDIPRIYQEAASARNRERGFGDVRINPQEFEADFPTNIANINVRVKKSRRAYDGKSELYIGLEFSDETREAILAQK